MRIKTVGIGGSGSGVGKTALACALLGALKNWGAIKFTPDGLYSAVIDDPAVLLEKGKDTERLIRAGASGVLWVRTAPGDIEETAGIALHRLSHLEGVIVEGNSAIEVLKPDIVIFLRGKGELKEGSSRAMDMADVVIDGRIGCAQARRLAEATGIAYSEMGRIMDNLHIKITACELGCF